MNTQDLMKMTDKQRERYWQKKRQEEYDKRQKSIDALTNEQRKAIERIYEMARDIVHQGLYEGGPRYIYCDTFHELDSAVEIVCREFNLRDKE
jgi:hypothetical protein|tara:strand:+ start:269 stop:547 length:279 start_codon:yes stop_codon:yes gene_type:complete